VVTAEAATAAVTTAAAEAAGAVVTAEAVGAVETAAAAGAVVTAEAAGAVEMLRGQKPTTPHDRCDWPGELNITSSTLPPAPQGQARLTHDSELPLLQIPPSSSWGAAVANLEPATSQN